VAQLVIRGPIRATDAPQLLLHFLLIVRQHKPAPLHHESVNVGKALRCAAMAASKCTARKALACVITLYDCVTTPVPVQITVDSLRLPPSWFNHAYCFGYVGHVRVGDYYLLPHLLEDIVGLDPTFCDGLCKAGSGHGPVCCKSQLRD
jgi:hypothetical protein